MRDATAYDRMSGRSGAESCPAAFWQAPVPYLPDAPTVGEAIAVFANEARWIAQCPDCNGAQLASQSDPRFMCNECANIANGGAWRPLTWPRNRAAIEQALDVRQPVNQNWLPGETVADLTADNALNGVGTVP